MCGRFMTPPSPHLLWLEIKWIKSWVHPLIWAQYSSCCLDALRPSVYFTPHWPTSTKNEDNSLAQRHVCLMQSFYVRKWNCMEMAQKRDHCVPVPFPSLSNMSAGLQMYIVRSVTVNIYIRRAAAGANCAAGITQWLLSVELCLVLLFYEILLFKFLISTIN